LLAPMKNISRCGARASRAGESASLEAFKGMSMVKVCRSVVSGRADEGRA
jgi:hypothetical protein